MTATIHDRHRGRKINYTSTDLLPFVDLLQGMIECYNRHPDDGVAVTLITLLVPTDEAGKFVGMRTLNWGKPSADYAAEIGHAGVFMRNALIDFHRLARMHVLYGHDVAIDFAQYHAFRWAKRNDTDTAWGDEPLHRVMDAMTRRLPAHLLERIARHRPNCSASAIR